ncbi:MAG: metal-dependent hydrolase [Gemmatimonadota bacterium]
MDTVTHGLTGWLIARAVPTEKNGKAATAAVVLGSVLPDADHVASFFGSEAAVRFHRGISHSFAGVAVSSLLVALLFYRFGKWKDLKKLYLLTLAGQLSHIALDVITSYGTQVLQPFSDARVSFDLLFIIDLLFTGIVAAGIWLSRRHRPAMARGALAALALYVGFTAVLHARAEDAVRAAAERNGVPVVAVAALPRLTEIDVGTRLAKIPLVGEGEAWAAEELARLPALPIPAGAGRYPFPAGPFSWNGFVDDGRTYLRADVNPFTEGVTWRQRVVRGRDVPAVKALASLPDVQTYLWFARFPVVQASRAGSGTVLTFSDLRFGGVPGRRRPFVLKVIQEPGRLPSARWGG